MRRLVSAIATALAFALGAQGVPALAASARPTAAPSAVRDAPNRAADQFDIWSALSPEVWDESLEEGCIEDGGTACKMTAAQVAKIPDDIKKLTEQLRSEIVANPQEQAELKADRQTRPRAFGGIASKVVGTITKFTKNPAVRKLADKADDIGEVAGYVTNSTYAANGLTEGTATAIAKSVVYMMPVVGDVFSLGEAIASGDVESGVVAAVSLVGTAVGAVFPPAGAVVAVGLAAYYVAKLLFGWLAAKPRDWIAEPPGTPDEMAESGAYFGFEMYKVAGKQVPIVLHTTGRSETAQTVQTLLLDSRWTKHNRDRRPVTYLLPAGGAKPLTLDTRWANDGATIAAWQNGRQYQGTCSGEGYYECGFTAPLTIALDKPAVLKITYTYTLSRDSLDYCTGSPPCVPRAYVDDYADLSVLSESKQPVALAYGFTYGIDR